MKTISSLFRGRSEELFDVSLERLAIHGTFEHKGCGHSIMTQSCDECDGLPVSVQHLLDQPFSFRRPAIEARDRRRHAGFVDEHELSRIKSRLPPLQRFTGGGHVRAVLLGRPKAFF